MSTPKLRTAVIGAGKMGQIHAKVYHQLPQSELIAIVDSDEKLNIRLSEMKIFLKNKGYPMKIIEDAVTNAKQHDKDDLCRPKEASGSEATSIAFVTTYNPNNPDVKACINRTLGILDTSERMKKVMKDTRIIKSRRQPPNLKKMLTTAKFSRNQMSAHKVTKCGNKRCKCCDNITESETISLENGQTFQVRANMNCNSSNLLYIITCNGCKKQYIGETGDILRNRMRVHRQQIRDKNTRMLNVSEHIDQCAKVFPYFSVFPFYKFTTDNVVFRHEKEQYFIRKYKPTLNGHL
jgi:hypothetical protein